MKLKKNYLQLIGHQYLHQQYVIIFLNVAILNVLPRSTHMLTSSNKQRRIEWAQQHQNNDFTHTIFTDEASFQLFRNTVRRWTKCPNNELKRIPKNRQNVHV